MTKEVEGDRRETAICRYTVKPGKEPEMLKLLARHWPTLHSAGLVTDDRPLIFRGTPMTGKDRDAVGSHVFVEIFTWRDAKAVETAHHNPEVMSVWEPMGQICDRMEFPHFERISLP
jgi:hypothetical protein